MTGIGALVIAGLLVVLLVAATAHQPKFCISAAAREEARALMFEGLDMGLKQYTAHLFQNRLRDREPDPDRIVRGMQSAIVSYARSRDVVTNWSPPVCP